MAEHPVTIPLVLHLAKPFDQRADTMQRMLARIEAAVGDELVDILSPDAASPVIAISIFEGTHRHTSTDR